MLIRVFIFAGILLLANASQAQTANASPSLEQRVADLEAYVNNARAVPIQPARKAARTFLVPVRVTTRG